MENIIQQIITDFLKNITKKTYSEKLQDIDALAVELEGDCKAVAVKIIETAVAELNKEIREDKETRKEQGLVLKEKNRHRETFTALGSIDVSRDYYFNKNLGEYTFVMDQLIGIKPYERIGDAVSAAMVNFAAEVSYAKSACWATDGKISRQSVRNKILKVNLPLKEIPEEKKKVKELHIYADEDHVHMQKPNKTKGKKNQIVPLVTVTEGTRKVSNRRNETINPMRFVDENIKADRLWKTVDGYIESTYDADALEKIYIHGDGGGWITNGLEDRETIHVMDGYHFEKGIKALARTFPKRNVKAVLRSAINENDKKKADAFLQSLIEESGSKEKDILEFGKYLMNNWKEIYNLETLDIPGSCTEAQVSHVLSKRFSRCPMGWSKEALGKLSFIRVAGINGRKIEARDFKESACEKSYATYIDEMIKGAKDWSIFDGEPLVFDRASGTQILMDYYGTNYGTVN